MSAIQLHLPPQAKIVGSLNTRSDLNMLDQDMLYIELPDSIFICVGWYPDLDPQGEYRLVVFQETISQPLEEPVHTKDVRKIKAAIYTFVEKYLAEIASAGSVDTLPALFVNGTVEPAPPKQFQTSSLAATARSSRVRA